MWFVVWLLNDMGYGVDWCWLELNEYMFDRVGGGRCDMGDCERCIGDVIWDSVGIVVILYEDLGVWLVGIYKE